MSLCSFGRGGVDEKRIIFSPERAFYFFEVDTVELKYKLYQTVFQDSSCLVGREKGFGEIIYRDSMLIFMRNEYKCPMIIFSNNKKIKKGHTKVIIIDAGICDLKSIRFYGGENQRTGITYHPDNIDATFNFFDLPMDVEAMEIDFADETTPLIKLDSLLSDFDNPQHRKNVTIKLDKPKRDKQKYNLIWVLPRRFPLHEDYHLWFGDNRDTLISKACFSRPYDEVHLTRDKRIVVTYKDENYCPPIF